MTTLEADPMKMSEDERQCLSESRGGSANVISIFSYCARRYSEGYDDKSFKEWRQKIGGGRVGDNNILTFLFILTRIWVFI